METFKTNLVIKNMSYVSGTNNSRAFICVRSDKLDNIIGIVNNSVPIFVIGKAPVADYIFVSVKSNVNISINDLCETVSELDTEQFDKAIADRVFRVWDDKAPWVLSGVNGVLPFCLVPEQESLKDAVPKGYRHIFVMNQTIETLSTLNVSLDRFTILNTKMDPEKTLEYLENLPEQEFLKLYVKCHTIPSSEETVNESVQPKETVVAPSDIMARFQAANEKFISPQIDAIIEDLVGFMEERKPNLGDYHIIFKSYDEDAAKRVAHLVSVRTGNKNITVERNFDQERCVYYYF